jgi:hypothetical protein
VDNAKCPYFDQEYENVQRVLEESNVKVYNATVGGKLEVLSHVDFEDLLYFYPS